MMDALADRGLSKDDFDGEFEFRSQYLQDFIGDNGFSWSSTVTNYVTVPDFNTSVAACCRWKSIGHGCNGGIAATILQF